MRATAALRSICLVLLAIVPVETPAAAQDSVVARCRRIEQRIAELSVEAEILGRAAGGSEIDDMMHWQSRANSDPLQWKDHPDFAELLGDLGLRSAEDRARVLQHPNEARGLLRLAAMMRWSELRARSDQLLQKKALIDAQIAFERAPGPNGRPASPAR